MKFKISMFKEEFDELTGNLKEKLSKEVEMTADSCCEACIKATKSNRGWTVSKWENLEGKNEYKFVPENKYEKEAWAKVLKEQKSKKNKKNEQVSE